MDMGSHRGVGDREPYRYKKQKNLQFVTLPVNNPRTHYPLDVEAGEEADGCQYDEGHHKEALLRPSSEKLFMVAHNNCKRRDRKIERKNEQN